MNVLYVENWSDQTRKPHPGEDWITPERAREMFESGAGILVVDAETRTPDGLPLPRWVIGFATNGWVRTQWFTPHMSLWRLSDYEVIDGRLWRGIVVDYAYPDDTRQYFEFESLHHITTSFDPDGTTTVNIVEPSTRTGTRGTASDVPVGRLWLDRPVFGAWEQLADPDYGLPTDADYAAQH